MFRSLGPLAALALALGAVGSEASPAARAPGGLKGRVSIGVGGIRIDQLAPLVVYLDGVEGKISFVPPADIPVVSQKDVRFSPPFLVIAAGQTVSLANDDRIVHNVFSYSPPKRFDLGLYPRGESRQVRFDTPGVIDLFCSIHAKMNASIFVAPSPYFALVGPGGDFEISGIPPGKYRFKCWSRKIPTEEEPVEVASGATRELALEILRPK